MIKILTPLAILYSCCQITFAQTIAVNPSQIQFGNQTTSIADSAQIVISFQGISTDSISIKNIQSLNPNFYVKETSFRLSQNQSKTIWVYFNPIQNIKHVGYLVVQNNSIHPQVLVQLQGTGVYKETYYAATQNLTEEALKTALKTIVSNGQANCTYNGARDQMFMTIDNKKTNGQGAATNTLECIYTGREAIGFISRTDAQTSSNFNTEHTWPQSLFSSSAPMVCDLHHLFPTDEAANGTRSNYPFGMVTNPTWTVGGSKYASSVFEPRDQQKGRTARAMIYFVLRYQDYNTFFAPQENILRLWHKQFAPNNIDEKRNQDIFAFQGNRNPFIDHPEILERITLLAGTSIAPVRKTIYYDSTLVRVFIDGNQSIDTSLSIKISLVNTGNATTSYAAGLSNQFLSIASAALGAINIDSSITFVIRYAPSSSSYIIRDTLVVLSNATNASIMRIPIEINYNQTTSLTEMNQTPFTFYCFPNPSNNILNISSQNNKEFAFSLITLQGQEIMTGHTKSTFQVNTSTLTNGMYFLIGNTLSQSFRTKIQIQH